MKISGACITAAILLFFMLFGTISSAIYLNDTATRILSQIDALPDDALPSIEAATSIRDFWVDRKSILSFTLSETSLDGISLLFDELLITIENFDNEEYQKATARLRRAVESINQLEKLSLQNIF